MRVGIISSHLAGYSYEKELGQELDELIKALKNKGHDVELIDPLSTTIGIIEDHCFARFKCFDGVIRDAKGLDILLVRRTSGHIDEILDFCKFASKQNERLIVLDPIESMGRPTSKVESIAHRAENVNQPSTQVLRHVGELDERLTFPLVCKPMHGTSGVGVKLCSTSEELSLELETSYGSRSGYAALIQSDVTGEHEFRVVVVNGQALGVASKPKSNTEFARNERNVDGFKSYEGINKKQVMKFAEDISLKMGHFFSGVDIIQKGKRFYVIECNRNPQFRAFDAALKAENREFPGVAHYVCHALEDQYYSQSGISRRSERKIPDDANYKPTIFIGSSSEGVRVAETIQWGLERFDMAEATVWTQDVFRPSHTTYANLLQAPKRFDFAVFCITADDKLRYRDTDVLSPRDNIIFEAGLFIGVLGPEKVFFVVSKDESVKLPTDINGVNLIYWKPHESGNLRPALGSALYELSEAMGLDRSN